MIDVLAEIRKTRNLSSILAWASTYDNAAHDLIALFVYLVDTIFASGVSSCMEGKGTSIN